MKTSLAFLILASSLLIGSVAQADPPSHRVKVANGELAAIFSSPAFPGCAAKPVAQEAVPSSDKAVACGPCSDSLCQGKSWGSTCKTLGVRTYMCRHAWVSCDLYDCQCWYGPLP